MRKKHGDKINVQSHELVILRFNCNENLLITLWNLLLTNILSLFNKVELNSLKICMEHNTSKI